MSDVTVIVNSVFAALNSYPILWLAVFSAVGLVYKGISSASRRRKDRKRLKQRASSDIPTPSIPACWSPSGEHDFQPRYNTRPMTDSQVLLDMDWDSAPDDVIELMKNAEYVCDVCTSCGAITAAKSNTE